MSFNKAVSHGEAMTWIASTYSKTMSPPNNVLGKQVLDYLRWKYLPVSLSSLAVSPAGRMLQQSQLTFCFVSDPKDTLYSWECPAEHTFAGGSSSSGGGIIKATPCDTALLNEMERPLAKLAQAGEATTKMSKAEAKDAAADAADEIDKSSNEDDEDVFGNVGDYNGATAVGCDKIEKDNKTANKDSTDDSKRRKVHIFDEKPSRSSGASSTPEDRSRIDSTTTDPATAAARPLYGLSSVSGYDDDGIDMDFDARDDDDEDRDKRKKKKKIADP